MAKAEPPDLIALRPDSGTQQQDWDAQHVRLAKLREDGCYGVMWVEATDDSASRRARAHALTVGQSTPAHQEPVRSIE